MMTGGTNQLEGISFSGRPVGFTSSAPVLTAGVSNLSQTVEERSIPAHGDDRRDNKEQITNKLRGVLLLKWAGIP
jgi:hypothetical protein